MPDVESVVELVITDVAYGGRGVGRVEGCVVFLPGVITGEQVKARLTSVRKRYAQAELVEILKASPMRAEESCVLAGECPGCCYQHVEYEEEVRLKQTQFQSLLKRIGGVTVDVYRSPLPSPLALGYRNKIVLHSGPEPEKALGYFGADNRTVIDVAVCPLAVDPINERLTALRSDPRFTAGLSPGTSVSVRWSEADGVRSWCDRAPGGDMLREKTSLGTLDVPLRAFFQVNPWMAGALVTTVAEIVKSVAPRYLLDLYCGVGLFGMAAAAAGVPHVLGVDQLHAAVRAATENSRRLGFQGIEFVAADVDQTAEAALQRTPPADTFVIVDPPRQGLGKMTVETLVRRRPATLVYVSCAADTLARDISRLRAGGYEVTQAQLLDMFPRTSHFESVTILATGP